MPPTLVMPAPAAKRRYKKLEHLTPERVEWMARVIAAHDTRREAAKALGYASASSLNHMICNDLDLRDRVRELQRKKARQS